MGCDTIGRIRGYVTVDEIKDYLINHLDCTDVHLGIKTNKIGPLSSELDFNYELKDNHKDDTDWIIDSGFINFTINNHQRSIFYSYQNINTFENLDFYKSNYPEYPYITDMIKSDTTYISLGYDDEAVNIISSIISAFGGGMIDKNDCDDEPFILIEN